MVGIAVVIDWSVTGVVVSVVVVAAIVVVWSVVIGTVVVVAAGFTGLWFSKQLLLVAASA